MLNWFRRNVVALIGVAMACAALLAGISTYQSVAKRNEQARGIPLRLKRGEDELADRHRRAVKLLDELANAQRTNTVSAAVFAMVIAVWAVNRPRASIWLAVLTFALCFTGVGFAHGNRAEPIEEVVAWA